MNKEWKDKESLEIESLQGMVKELTNIVIDLKENNGESSSKQLKAWKNKINNPKPWEVKGMNFQEKTMDCWCQPYIDYHSDRIFHKFINMYKLINMYNTFLEPIAECTILLRVLSELLIAWEIVESTTKQLAENICVYTI